MKFSRISLMTIAVLVGFFVIFLLNVANKVGIVPSRYISQNEVRGIAVEHNHLLYTLNFDQQNMLVDIFNRFIPVTKEQFESRRTKLKNPPQIDKIIVYRFNAPDVVLTLEGFVTKTSSIMGGENEVESSNLVFSAPEWEPKGFLEEAASDELDLLLLKTYDP
jgi:hypothetical protein